MGIYKIFDTSEFIYFKSVKTLLFGRGVIDDFGEFMGGMLWTSTYLGCGKNWT